MNLRRFSYYLAIFGKVNTKNYTLFCPSTSSSHFMFPFCFFNVFSFPQVVRSLWTVSFRESLEIFPILWKPAWQESIISMSLDAPFSNTKWIKIALKTMLKIYELTDRSCKKLLNEEIKKTPFPLRIFIWALWIWYLFLPLVIWTNKINNQ